MLGPQEVKILAVIAEVPLRRVHHPDEQIDLVRGAAQASRDGDRLLTGTALVAQLTSEDHLPRRQRSVAGNREGQGTTGLIGLQDQGPLCPGDGSAIAVTVVRV